MCSCKPPLQTSKRIGNQRVNFFKKMLSLKPCKTRLFSTPFSSPKSPRQNTQTKAIKPLKITKLSHRVRACSTGQEEGAEKKRTFLTVEEAGLIEISGLDTHERFLCRITVSSLNLLRVIAEQEECSIEDLNAGKLCDWFVKDKLKREQNIGSSVLQWNDSGFPL